MATATVRDAAPSSFFDIDGTLVLTGGAGVRAMSLAFEELFGHASAFEQLPGLRPHRYVDCCTQPSTRTGSLHTTTGFRVFRTSTCGT